MEMSHGDRIPPGVSPVTSPVRASGADPPGVIYAHRAMPKILAPTLTEHRDMRRSALIGAAAALARESGSTAITMAAVAQRAGLSRTAVYEYFRSSADLVADLILDELAIWAHELQRAVGSHGGMVAVDAWVRAALHYVADGQHALARALGEVTVPEDRHGEVAAMHRLLIDPLMAPLRQWLGHEADAAAGFIHAAVEASTRRIERGGDPDTEIARTLAFIDGGLRALADRV